MADTEYGTEILLLERIQKVLDEAADGQTGSVKMDRGMLDELRAEVTQVRLALKARGVRALRAVAWRRLGRAARVRHEMIARRHLHLRQRRGVDDGVLRNQLVRRK